VAVDTDAAADTHSAAVAAAVVCRHIAIAVATKAAYEHMTDSVETDDETHLRPSTFPATADYRETVERKSLSTVE